MACEQDGWGLREYVASNVAVPEELRPQRVAVLCVGNRLMLDDVFIGGFFIANILGK